MASAVVAQEVVVRCLAASAASAVRCPWYSLTVVRHACMDSEKDIDFFSQCRQTD
jgi:hypothetical protein